MHCFLSPSKWINAINWAGYGIADIRPDLDALNDYFQDLPSVVITTVA